MFCRPQVSPVVYDPHLGIWKPIEAFHSPLSCHISIWGLGCLFSRDSYWSFNAHTKCIFSLLLSWGPWQNSISLTWVISVCILGDAGFLSSPLFLLLAQSAPCRSHRKVSVTAHWNGPDSLNPRPYFWKHSFPFRNQEMSAWPGPNHQLFPVETKVRHQASRNHHFCLRHKAWQSSQLPPSDLTAQHLPGGLTHCPA